MDNIKQRAAQWVDKHAYLNKIRTNAVLGMIDVVKGGHEVEPGRFEVHVADFVDGHHGTYMSKIAAEMFEFDEVLSPDDEGYEWQMEDVEKFAAEVTEVIEKKLNLPVGRLSSGYLDSDGSYSLLYIVENPQKVSCGCGDEEIYDFQTEDGKCIYCGEDVALGA